MRFQRAHQLAAEQAAERVKHQVVHVAQAVRAAEHEKQPRELPQLDKRRKRERRERDPANIQPADIAQVHTKRQQHQNVAHDLQHRAVQQRRQIGACIGEHERRLAQEIGHKLKRNELDPVRAQLCRLRRIRQREEHERQHAQHVKQKQTAERGAHPVEAARTHLPAEKRHGHQRRDERKRIARQPDTAQKICHDPCLPWGAPAPVSGISIAPDGITSPSFWLTVGLHLRKAARQGAKKPGASQWTRPAMRTDIFPQATRKNFTRKITEITYVSTETSLPLPVQSLSTE